MPCLRRICATGTPASPSFRIATICDSLNFDFFIRTLLDRKILPEKSTLSCLSGGEAYVFNHGRAQAHDGDAKPIYCLIRDENRVVAGGLGRTEYLRLFVQHLWVAEHVRNQGIGSRILRD